MEQLNNTAVTYLVVDVLFAPFWSNVCGKMLGELHLNGVKCPFAKCLAPIVVSI